MTDLSNLDKFYYKTYYESCNEFEEVRELCLSEDNWLRHLYTKENLQIEKHYGYNVIYTVDTHEPVGMAGVFHDDRYPPNVARNLHREYFFPKFRQKSLRKYINVTRILTELVINPLIKANNFDCYIIAMQNRDKKKSKGYWKIFSESAKLVDPAWMIGEHYIQTCPFNVQKCWQNYLYIEVKPGSFTEWNPELITQDEWDLLEPGI